MRLLIILLGLLMFAGAVAVLFQKSLRNAVFTFGAVNMISALMFVLMRAYDVALAQVAIGAGLTTAIFLWTVRRLVEDGYREKK
ncbi:hypothetical protein ES703_70560 [subsurface metagenome]